MLSQFQMCEDTGIPFCVVIGEKELQEGVVTLRDMSTREEVRARTKIPTPCQQATITSLSS